MPCTRCAGLRVPEIICEGGTRLLAMRCIHCGDVIDHVIARNRCRSPRPKHGREGRTPIYGDLRWKKDNPPISPFAF